MATQRFKVVVTSIRDGVAQERTRRAGDPVTAVAKALISLGMTRINEPPFQVFVQPIGDVRHG